jgi:hypothetical protein
LRDPRSEFATELLELALKLFLLVDDLEERDELLAEPLECTGIFA